MKNIVMRRLTLVLAVIAVIVVTSLIFHHTQTYQKVFERGLRAFKDGKYRIALPYFISAFNRKPDDLAAAHYLLRIYERMGEPQNVRAILEHIVEKDAGDLGSKLYLADLYYGNSNYGKAEELYKQFLQEQPRPEVRARYVEVLVWQKKYSEAIPELESFIAEHPQDLQKKEFLGDIYTWQKEYAKAEAVYKELLVDNFRPQDIALKCADVLRYLGKNEEAIALYDEYIGKK